jgi:hypothetical protein
MKITLNDELYWTNELDSHMYREFVRLENEGLLIPFIYL